MKFFRGSLIAAALCALCFGAAIASPTLSETEAWLTANLPSLTVSDDGMANATHVVKYSFNGCNMHVIDKFTNVQSTNPSDTTFYVIEMAPYPGKSLYAADPVSRKFKPDYSNSPMDFGDEMHVVVPLGSIDLAGLRVTSHRVNSAQPQTSSGTEMVFGSKAVYIGTTDADLAQRSLKALTRAATLCGAKASAF